MAAHGTSKSPSQIRSVLIMAATQSIWKVRKAFRSPGAFDRDRKSGTAWVSKRRSRCRSGNASEVELGVRSRSRRHRPRRPARTEPQDDREVAQAGLRARRRHGAEDASLDGAHGRGGSRGRRLPTTHAAALDDCLYALQATVPHLTRLSLHRCLQCHGISRLPEVGGDKPAKQAFKADPINPLHIDIAEVRTEEGKLYLWVGIDRTSKYAFAQLHERPYRLHTS